MKKQFKKVLFFAMFFIALALSVVAFGQTDSTSTSSGAIPVNDINLLFGSISSLAVGTLVLTGYLKTHIASSMNTQLLSWIVAVGLGFIGFALDLGIFADCGVLWTVIYSLAGGLNSNGVADVGLIQSLLTAIGAKVPKSK